MHKLSYSCPLSPHDPRWVKPTKLRTCHKLCFQNAWNMLLGLCVESGFPTRHSRQTTIRIWRSIMLYLSTSGILSTMAMKAALWHLYESDLLQHLIYCTNRITHFFLKPEQSHQMTEHSRKQADIIRRALAIGEDTRLPWVNVITQSESKCWSATFVFAVFVVQAIYDIFV